MEINFMTFKERKLFCCLVFEKQDTYCHEAENCCSLYAIVITTLSPLAFKGCSYLCAFSDRDFRQFEFKVLFSWMTVYSQKIIGI